MRIEVTRRISAEPEWVSKVWERVFSICRNATGVEDEAGRIRSHNAYLSAFLGHSEHSCEITLRAENNNRVIGYYRFNRNTDESDWGFYDKFSNKLILY